MRCSNKTKLYYCNLFYGILCNQKYVVSMFWKRPNLTLFNGHYCIACLCVSIRNNLNLQKSPVGRFRDYKLLIFFLYSGC